MPETTAPDAETKPPAMPLAGLPPGAALAIEAVRGTGTAGLVALVLYNFLSAQIGDVTSRLDQVTRRCPGWTSASTGASTSSMPGFRI